MVSVSHRHLGLGFAAMLAAMAMLLVPVGANEYLRFVYVQTLAHWKAKLVAPRTVYLGDSITAGGRRFNGWGDINLGSNGLTAFQIEAGLSRASDYHPEHIAVMAGTNDAIAGPVDAEEMARIWAGICARPNVVVTLAPPTRIPELNARITEINAIAREQCADAPVLSLDELADESGLIQERYTVDGVHLSRPAYAVWKRKLAEAGL